MSYLHPGIDTQRLIDSAFNSTGLGNLSRIEEASRLKRLKSSMTHDQYANYLARLEKKNIRPVWTPKDQTLVNMGVSVDYAKDNARRILDRFDSRWVQIKLKQAQSKFSESDLLEKVSKIKGDCNLAGTTIEKLPDLKKIEGSLTLDTSSALKDLSGIKKIAGSVLVHAKSKEQMQKFLEAINLPLKSVGGNIVFIMKNYL